MRQLSELLFYLGLGSLITHELDAMTHHEWRLLPILNSLAESDAAQLFVILHVPVFAILIALLASLNLTIRLRARQVTAAFMVVHAMLHTLLQNHPAYTFHDPLAYSLIYSAGICGCIYFLTSLRTAQ